MSKSLVIVESPAKARTISRFLGNDKNVLASMGHIRDLPPRSLGVDVHNQFQPLYVETAKGKKIIKELKKVAAKANDIYLAPDPDREGEAIAWHLQESLKDCTKATFHRVSFHEITKSAIAESFEHPTKLDINKVDAQQARRVLDRLVGFQVSPKLWHIKKRTSAGRVQSIALRLVCEREREIQAFEPKEYWNMEAMLLPAQCQEALLSKLVKLDGKKPDIGSADEANALAAELEIADFKVAATNQKARRKFAPPPFITSTLQQAASSHLYLGTSQTMRLAQQLYEGIELGVEGAIGLITYMRTDSVSLSKDATAQAREYIAKTYGSQYVPAKVNTFKSGKSAQEAHEAIRPTDVTRTPKSVAQYLNPQQLKVYTLIWNRFVACQMAPAQFLDHSIDFVAEGNSVTHAYVFRATARETLFLGYQAVYNVADLDQDDTKALKTNLPKLPVGTGCTLEELLKKQCFTEPPRRFSEATLVRELEQNGVGRPSTYATIVNTIQEREYVTREKRRLVPTELGFIINDYLVKHFPELFQITFTADMESKLDDIEEGKINWREMLKTFYTNFKQWLNEEGMEAPDNEVVESFLTIFHDNIEWAEPVKLGRRTFDDKKFITSIKNQLEKGKHLSDRQWMALLNMAAKYAQQLPALNEKVAKMGITELMDKAILEAEKQKNQVKEINPQHLELSKLLEIDKVEWAEPVKRGKRTYDDKKFYTSLCQQIESGRKLSDPQLNALKKLIVKYKKFVKNFETAAEKFELSSEGVEITPEQKLLIQGVLDLGKTISKWNEPVKRGKRTYDDSEFYQSVSQQFEQKGLLSDRQLGALKKMLGRYKEQIPNYKELVAKYDLPPAEKVLLKEKCPDCGEPLTIRKGRGRAANFYGCSTYPKCKFTSKTLPV